MTGVSFAHHGQAPCLEDVDLTVEPGRCHLVEGPSGCGKSTLLRMACGLIPRVHGGRVSGRVTLGGDPVWTLGPSELAGRIGFVPQDPEAAFVTRRVVDELEEVLANTGTTGSRARARIDELLHEVDAWHLAHRELATLSGGEAARISLAAALAAEPELLILDEADAHLDQAATDQLVGTLRALKAGGLTLLASGHRPHGLVELADEITPLGELEPTRRPPVLPAPEPGDALVVAQAFTHRFEGGAGVGPLSLALDPGEMIAITGPNGSGKTTLLDLLGGLLDPQDGTLELAGHRPRKLPAHQLARHVGRSFQHPAWHITQDTVHQEARLTADAVSRSCPVGQVLTQLGLEHLADRHPWDLSGGQRQRLAVATATAHQPPLLLLDEPTRGLDARARWALADLIAERTRAGLTTVVATHHPWLIELAHRRIHLEAGMRAPHPARAQSEVTA